VIVPAQSAPADSPEALAVELAQNPSISLSDWGEWNGLAPWMVSRGFEQVFWRRSFCVPGARPDTTCLEGDSR
jgi:hypothetical protein